MRLRALFWRWRGGCGVVGNQGSGERGRGFRSCRQIAIWVWRGRYPEEGGEGRVGGGKVGGGKNLGH